MRNIWIVTPGMLFCAATMAFLAAALNAEPPQDKKAASQVDEQHRVTIAVARDRAKVMHDIYEATLDVIHHRYFHRERAMVPARAMEDVFAAMKRQSQVEARWIAVNLKAMSVDHEPETEFEKQAVKEIAAGKPAFDAIEDGYYRRAGSIPLDAGCVSCHAGFFKDATAQPKYAALVISVPIVADSDEAVGK